MEDIFKDSIIVKKIDFEKIEEVLINDGNLEKEQIAAEYEAIVKKQLQMLQADERGRQALQNEIGEIGRKQEKRAEVLRMRARALEIEKERAKKIANRPPPLPRSVKLLLKEQAKKDLELVNEATSSNMSPLEEFLEDIEDKENIHEEYLVEKQKMQEEWDKKAKKRFNEALKKDHQKQEHHIILKEIEDAEKLNRRQMAKNISEPMGKVPCYLPDKLHHAEKQIAVEDAVDDVFKERDIKEHAVEDLEGYEDKWETTYQQMESRMVDCVPSFVKENYSYLLEEETTLQCGKHFSGLDDNIDLNMAYIEFPPADILNNSKEINAVINHLDQMRVELNEAYEKEFKPLLKAGVMPKIVSLDKSVEANILKLPTEDKGVEVERTPSGKEAPLSSRGVQANILQGGVMSFQRKNLGKIYKSHANSAGRYLPESFACQSDAASEVRSPRSALESWSSSSYWSLPLKHGLPKVCDSLGCTIPLAKNPSERSDCVAVRSFAATDETGYSPTDELHSNLTPYIQLVADKYLIKSTNSPETKEISDIGDHTSKAHSKGPSAFSKLKISDTKTTDTDLAQTSSVYTHDEIGEHFDHLGLNLLKSSENAILTNVNSFSEDELLRNCHEVIAANISDALSADNRFDSISAEVSCSSDQSDLATEHQHRKESLTGYVYHDLSTIPEMDSVLTTNIKELSLNETDLEAILPVEVDTTSASLIHAPVSVVLERAKSIHFIRKPTPEPVEGSEEHVALISGTLTDLQTPSSVVSEVQTTKYKISSIQRLSEIDSTIDTKTSDGSYDLLTPSPASTLKSVSCGYHYSSSYQDSNTAPAYLASTSALSKYFQDVSSIRHDSKVSSKGSAEGAISDKIDTRRQTEVLESSSGTWLPMTPQSYLSTPDVSGNQKVQNSMKRTRPSPQKNKNVLGIIQAAKPLTSHSYFSTDCKITTEHTSLNAKPSSTKSDDHYTSCIGVSSRKNIDDSNPDNFKPLSLYSNVSTPKSTDVASNKKDPQLNAEYQYESATSSNFQLMTPHSYISNPSDVHTSSSNSLNEFSNGKEITKGSVNLRIRIPNPFKNKAASPNHKMQGKSESFPYPIQLGLNSKDIMNSCDNYIMEGPCVQEDLSMDNLLQVNPSARQISKALLKSYVNSVNTDVEHVTKDKKTVKVSSSGFVPHLTVEDFTLSERNENNKDMFAAELLISAKNAASSKANSTSKSPNRPLHLTNDAEFLQLENNSSAINNDLKNRLEKVLNSSSSVENELGYSSLTRSEVPSTSPNPILQALLTSSSAKNCTPCAAPSNSSSAGNPLEIFDESKITHSLTPIKSIEELIEETGILEEPSLTLMNTEITLKLDSPEKSRLLSKGYSVMSDMKMPSSLRSAFFTPHTLDTPSDTASSPFCYDSPSMISFLNHEQSCLTAVNVEEDRSSAQIIQNEYKKRTKRLWNNLEEIKTKKLLEEKKEQLRKNRERMKLYGKGTSKFCTSNKK